MRLQIEVRELGQSTHGTNWCLRVAMAHQGERQVAECLLWETMPDSFADGLRKIADAVQEMASMCEHNVVDGEYCAACAAEYRRAAIENGCGE